MRSMWVLRVKVISKYPLSPKEQVLNKENELYHKTKQPKPHFLKN